MKKLFYSAAVAATAFFAACNPLSEIEKEVEQLPGEAISETYTLTKDDYNFLDVKYFSDDFLPQEHAPKFLANKFFTAGPSSNVVLNLDYYHKWTTEEELESNYEINKDDYEKISGRSSYLNLGSIDLLGNYLDGAILDPALKKEGTRLFVSYTLKDALYNYGEYEFDGTTWVKTAKVDQGFDVANAYKMSSDDYDTLGTEWGQPGRYDNFDKYNLDEYMPKFLSIKYPEATAGTVKTIKYKYYGYYDDFKTLLEYDGENWFVVKGDYYSFNWVTGSWEYSFIEETQRIFGYNGTAWEMVKLYTLTDADYTLVGEGKYKNLGHYYDKAGTFDGKEVENVLHAMLAKIMEANFSTEDDGTKFIVTYKRYTGSSTIDAKINMEKTADGWVVLD